MKMTGKQRAYLKGLAMQTESVFQIGKGDVTPEMVQGIDEALEARELVKISVLNNAGKDPKETAEVIAERTKSDVVEVIGKKIVLYRPAGKEEKRQIILPDTAKKKRGASGNGKKDRSDGRHV